MAWRSQINDVMRPLLVVPEKVEFSMFTEHDIKKLSIVKITTPMTVDGSGYPLNGGLYDKCLGPLSERSDPCGTCYKNMYQCPGHFAHIDLPLCVINPLFNKVIYTMLRLTCLKCFQVQLPGHIKHSLIVQMKLLRCGLIIEATEIEDKVLELIAQYGSFDQIPEDVVPPTKMYEDLAEEMLKESKHSKLNRNVENLRNEFTSNIIREYKSKRSCLYCKQAMDKITTLRNKIILTVSSKGRHHEEDPQAALGKVKSSEARFVTPEEAKGYMRSVWQIEKDMLCQLIPILETIEGSHPTDILFIKKLPVTPPNVRPVNIVKDVISENPQTKLYKSIMQNTMYLKIIMQVIKNEGNVDALPSEAQKMYSVLQGNSPIEKLNRMWEEIQNEVNNIVDRKYSKLDAEVVGEGIKQLIEKKQGIIRQNMMGKRVNYAARSVIAPDPNLNIEEVGIPEEFAKTLTYPVPVTTWNVEELRKLILNGPNVHPGAVMVEYENGQTVRIKPGDKTHQESILKRLLTPAEKKSGFKGMKVVYRHLMNGDVLLINRQPTLHKPSIMAHTARILKGQKTIRLHYANCKGYNADFDGDEMNAHFAQNELCRSEGYFIANVSNQYLVPKDGTPLSGLIQDHMVSGVRLSVRGKFFNKSDYQQLVYQALSFKTSEIIFLPPTIIKPLQLWSGKQVLSTVIINTIPQGRELINLTATSKISSKAWETSQSRDWISGGTPFTYDNCMTEAEVVIRKGELLVGVLDKTHYGATPYGLVHCMYELYGGPCATRLLSAFAKLFTYFLQRSGFTLGTQDILVTKKADKKRTKIVAQSRLIGLEAITKAINVPIDTPVSDIVSKIEELSATNPKLRATIDRQYKSLLDTYTNQINKTCLPAGLLSKFPENNLQLMVQSGAKGSTVNTMQISCLLGQIELEGKRPPIMISGKPLPCYTNYEFCPRAGGFVDGRFMTGITNQEFFFHCMAGREVKQMYWDLAQYIESSIRHKAEQLPCMYWFCNQNRCTAKDLRTNGLIDTAVKTSRSGYLQRCLVKHLEGLKVNYDMTVRDSDSSVVQFQYGEDGMDITKVQFLNKKQLPFLIDNIKAIVDKKAIKQLKSGDEYSKLEEHIEKFQAWVSAHGKPTKMKRKRPFTQFCTAVGPGLEVKNANKVDEKTGRERKTKHLMKLWRNIDLETKQKYIDECEPSPTPVSSDFQPDVYFGALNERLWNLVDEAGIKKSKRKKEFENMMKLKSIQSLCHPGEPVGLLAAQSVGEPSTQMTLNTFHFAGRGEMNVTLGIPRLREILMMASKQIRTPSMEIPFLDVPNLEEKAENLRKLLTRVVVADVLEKIHVNLRLETKKNRQHTYSLRFDFLPHKLYKSEYKVKPKFILKHMTKKFFGLMFSLIKKYSSAQATMVVIDDEKVKTTKKTGFDDDDDGDRITANNNVTMGDMDEDSSDEEPEDTEDAKQTRKFNETHEDLEPEEEEKEATSDDEENGSGAAKRKELEDDLEETEESATNTQEVLDTYNLAQNYKYDTKSHLWCELTFALPLIFKKLDLTAILREAAAKSVIWEVPQIRRAITYMKDDKLTLRTDGINMGEMFKYNELLDLNKLYSNDIHAIARTYGIEAAAKVIVKEVLDVFRVYGITVDIRHLSLIADYMTYTGKFEPLNRTGMENSAAPFQQMSFEASLNFLKGALMQGKIDHLDNPSSSLMFGKPCNTGTGSFSLLSKLT